MLARLSLLFRVVMTKLAPVNGIRPGHLCLSLALNRLLPVKLHRVRMTRHLLALVHVNGLSYIRMCMCMRLNSRQVTVVFFVKSRVLRTS